MTVRKIRKWLDTIDPEEADEQTFTELEDTLCEVEMTVEDLSSSVSTFEKVETYPEYISRSDTHTICRIQEDMEELYFKYSELLEDVREKFQAVDEQLYTEQ